MLVEPFSGIQLPSPQACPVLSRQVIDPTKGIADVPEWFKGSRLNYAENLLRHKENDKIALYAARKLHL